MAYKKLDVSRIVDGISYLHISWLASFYGEVRYQELDTRDVSPEALENISDMIIAKSKESFGRCEPNDESVAVLAAKIEERDMSGKNITKAEELAFLLKDSYTQKNLLLLDEKDQENQELSNKIFKNTKFY